jgi:MFS family permease
MTFLMSFASKIFQVQRFFLLIYQISSTQDLLVEVCRLPHMSVSHHSFRLSCALLLFWFGGSGVAQRWHIQCNLSIFMNRYYSFLPKFLISVPSFFSPQADYVIISFAGVPGSFAAMYAVNTFLGRKGTMLTSTVIVLISLLSFIMFSTGSSGSSNHSSTAFILLLANICASFASNIMWSVLYSFTPEVFPTPVRATAYGIASSFSKMAGLFAPLLTGLLVSIGGIELPLWVSVTFFALEATLMYLLPYDTRGVRAL